MWISEVMLQQTRVETVVSAFERFVELFPSVAAVAAASRDDILAAWSGLGYYRRARQLHDAAKEIAARGVFPSDLEDLRTLPGIGEYTAAAVASIAFGIVVPVLDGNVERVISRRLASARDPHRSTVRAALRSAAAALLDPARPGDSNQALMELGATICLPRAPRCPECPLRDDCLAFRAGAQELYPPPRRRRASERQGHLAAVVERAGRVLLMRRPEGSDVLGGTWEVPWVPVAPMAPAVAAEEALRERYGGRWRLGDSAGNIKHAITFRALEVEIRRAELEGVDFVAESVEARWFTRAELRHVPRSSLVQKILRLISA